MSGTEGSAGIEGNYLPALFDLTRSLKISWIKKFYEKGRHNKMQIILGYINNPMNKNSKWGKIVIFVNLVQLYRVQNSTDKNLTEYSLVKSEK